MDFAHLHLMLNHVPVIGSVFGFIILLASLFARSKGATAVGLILLVVSAIAAVPVYLTGEPAEEIVEKLPGVTESITGQHESAAAISLGLAIAAGLFAAAALVFSRVRTSKLPSYLVIATLMVALLTGVSMLQTANLGGQIRHTEIRSGGQNADPAAETKGVQKSSSKDDD